MAVSAIAKSKKPAKFSAAHPPYGEMIGSAIRELKERSGSSRQAISKYIKTHYKVDAKADSHLRRALVAGVQAGKLMRTKGTGASGSFKLADKSTGKEPAAPSVVKKAVKKPKTTKPTRKVKVAKPKKAPVKKTKKTTKPKKPVAKKPLKKSVKK